MEKNSKRLKDFLNSLPRADAKFAREAIKRACRINSNKLYNWTAHEMHIEPLYQNAIEKAIQKKIFI